MTLYERNLAYILKGAPRVYATLFAESVLNGNIEYLETTDKLRLHHGEKHIYLHSLHHQEREFCEMFRDVTPSVKRIVLFGLGDGKILSFIRKKFSRLEHLVVVEPYREVVLKFLQYYDFEEAFGPFKKVSLIINKSELEVVQELENILVNSGSVEQHTHVVGLYAYQIAYPEYYNGITQIALRSLRFYRLNRNTQEIFRQLWLVNYWRNLRHVSPSLNQMREVFQGRPAIIVSAGPSLNKSIHQLKQLKDKALIIAVGSAITILENNGITPHFRLAIDGTKENEPLFKDINTESCPLIYSDYLYYTILDGYKGPKLHISSTSHPIPDYFAHKAQWDSLKVRSGFSVANMALDMLQKLGSSPIIIVGQDLCYTDGKLHATGAWDDSLEQNNPWVNEELEVENIHGEKVYTDRAFLGMKLVFENLLKFYGKETFVINATGGGLKIEGMLHKPLEEVIEYHLQQSYNFTKEIQESIACEVVHLDEKRERMEKAVSDTEEVVKGLLKINEKNQQDLEKTLRLLLANGGKKQILKGVDKVTKNFQIMHNNEFYKSVLFPSFSEKFKLRHMAVSVDSNKWREILTADVKAFLSNMQELQGYLQAFIELMEEYQGKRKITILVK